jgi:predicted DNA-binding protein
MKYNKSFRLSDEAYRQLDALTQKHGRSQANVIEIALDRLYRQETEMNYYILVRDGQIDIISVTPGMDPLHGRGSWNLWGGPFETWEAAELASTKFDPETTYSVRPAIHNHSSETEIYTGDVLNQLFEVAGWSVGDLTLLPDGAYADQTGEIVIRPV